jgi:hypothetical protein
LPALSASGRSFNQAQPSLALIGPLVLAQAVDGMIDPASVPHSMAAQHALLGHRQLLYDPQRTFVARVTSRGYIRQAISGKTPLDDRLASEDASPSRQCFLAMEKPISPTRFPRLMSIQTSPITLVSCTTAKFGVLCPRFRIDPARFSSAFRRVNGLGATV